MALVLFSQISLVEALAVIQVCHKMVRAQRLACKPLFFVRLHATRSFSLVTNLKRTLSRGVHFGSNELGKKQARRFIWGRWQLVNCCFTSNASRCDTHTYTGNDRELKLSRDEHFLHVHLLGSRRAVCGEARFK
uniref:(northern house mosquito) hypothetical protein n=1 Tax=Culex pipiens TaxID=7175 RepID=A0A8D8KP36_CULPI